MTNCIKKPQTKIPSKKHKKFNKKINSYFSVTFVTSTMKVLSVLKFLSLLTISLSMPQRCFDQIRHLTHPYSCCKYPLLYEKNFNEECKNQCESEVIGEGKTCCLSACFFRKTEILENDQISDDNLSKFMNVSSKVNLMDEQKCEWEETKMKSIDYCHVFSKIFKFLNCFFFTNFEIFRIFLLVFF